MMVIMCLRWAVDDRSETNSLYNNSFSEVKMNTNGNVKAKGIDCYARLGYSLKRLETEVLWLRSENTEHVYMQV